MTDTKRRHSILCIESSEQSRQALEAMLHDYDCAFASDVHAAIQLADSSPSDAYVLDYWMPGWSGPLLCREIRKRDPHCPVIVCGNAADTSSENRAYRAGASAYLGKLDAHALTSKLCDLLAISELGRTQAQEDAGRVLGRELDRYSAMLAAARSGAGTPDELERTVRSPTFRSYIDSGGTRARFERWWPIEFETQRLEIARYADVLRSAL